MSFTIYKKQCPICKKRYGTTDATKNYCQYLCEAHANHMKKAQEEGKEYKKCIRCGNVASYSTKFCSFYCKKRYENYLASCIY